MPCDVFNKVQHIDHHQIIPHHTNTNSHHTAQFVDDNFNSYSIPGTTQILS